LALNFVAVNDDNAIAVFTGQSGGIWAEVAEYAESSGTDGAIQLQYSVVGDTVYGGPGTVWIDFGRYSSSRVKVAQGFTATGNVYAVGVGLKKYVNPTDDVLVSIQTDSSGAPSGTIVGTQVSVASASIMASDRGWHECAVNATLTPSSTYWIVIERVGALDETNYYGIGYANADLVASYEAKGYNGSAWVTLSAANADLNFSLIGASGGGTVNGGTASITDSDAWGVIGFALVGTTPEFYLVAYRFRNDDGTEATATWKADQDVDVTHPLDTNLRLRVEIQSVRGQSSTISGQLQYSLNGGAWTDVTGSSTAVRSSTSTGESGTTTTNQLTAATGTFQGNSGFEDVDGSAGGVGINASGQAEYEYCVTIRSAGGVGLGHTIEFRVVFSGPYLATYSSPAPYPTVTVAAVAEARVPRSRQYPQLLAH
jgi:hypothetical protein